jgi:hypothetical protein
MAEQLPINTNFKYRSADTASTVPLVVDMDSNVRDATIVITSNKANATGTFDVTARVSSSPFIAFGTPLSIDIATAPEFTAVPAGSFSGLTFTPNSIVGDTLTETDISFDVINVQDTDFVFDSVGKTITTISGDFSVYAVGATVVITGSVSNDGTYTVLTATTTVLTVNETLVDEGASVVRTDISFDLVTDTQTDFVFTQTGSIIASTLSDLSVYPIGSTIVITGTTSNNNTFTVLTSSAAQLTVNEAVVDESPATCTISGYRVSTVAGDFTVFSDTDSIDISGTASNNGNFTVSGTPVALVMWVAEAVVNEVAGASMTIVTSDTIDVDGYRISTVAGDFSVFVDGDTITVSGTASNNGDFTISGVPVVATMWVAEAVVNETAGASMTIVNTKSVLYTVYIQGIDSY